MQPFNEDNSLVVIPARAGSKRIPKKNIKLLGDKPLIAWTIEAAKQSSLNRHVLVSTDSHKIAEIAKEFGAIVPQLRANDAARDESPTRDAIVDAIAGYEDSYGGVVEWIVLLQPTSPFRTPETIDQAIQLFLENNGNSVVSVMPNCAPLSWLTHIDVNGCLTAASLRDHDDDLYRYNGVVYVFSRRTLITTGDIYSQSIIPLVMTDLIQSVDIDTADDWALAECLARGLQR